MPFVFAQFLIVGYYLDYYKRRKINSREVTMQTLKYILYNENLINDTIFLLYVYVKYYMVVLLMIQNYCLAAIFITTFIFTITWQFSPFILLLQSIALFYLGTISILDRDAVSKVIVATVNIHKVYNPSK